MGSISIIQRVAVGENIPQINDGSVNPIIPGLVNPFSPRGLGSQLAGVVDLWRNLRAKLLGADQSWVVTVQSGAQVSYLQTR